MTTSKRTRGVIKKDVAVSCKSKVLRQVDFSSVLILKGELLAARTVCLRAGP